MGFISIGLPSMAEVGVALQNPVNLVGKEL